MNIKAAIIGIIALILSAPAFIGNRDVFYQAYAFAFLIVVSVPLGAMSISAVHYLSHGRWGFEIRPFYLAAIKTFPLLALFAVPLFTGLESIYLWAQADVVANDPILLLKEPYLNRNFFIARTVFYFILWTGLGILLHRKSDELLHDTSDNSRMRLQLVAGLSLFAFVFTDSFAAFDWSMSLEPHWYSTMFGIWSVISQALTALAFMIVMASLRVSPNQADEENTQQKFHDLGNLTLVLVLLWAYMAFSQFFIIWSADLPEEVLWYLPRLTGGWEVIGTIVAIGHFFFPFFLLLNRTVKRTVAYLSKVAIYILILRVFDLAWTVLPTWNEHVSDLSLVHITLPIGLCSIWYAFFASKLKVAA